MTDEQRARDGLDHLQAAALQAIAATRAFLDVAEELVKEPGAVGDVVRTVQALATASFGGPMASGERPEPGTAVRGDDDDGRPSPVRRIHVS
jgi:hypothetical protein